MTAEKNRNLKKTRKYVLIFIISLLFILYLISQFHCSCWSLHCWEARKEENQKNICDFYEIYIWFSLLKIPERNYDELHDQKENGWRRRNEGRKVYEEEKILWTVKEKKCGKSFYIKVISFLRLFCSSFSVVSFSFIYLQSTVCALMTWKKKKDEWGIFVWEKETTTWMATSNIFPFFSHRSISRHDCYVWFSFLIWIRAQYINLWDVWKAKYPICFGDEETFFCSL